MKKWGSNGDKMTKMFESATYTTGFPFPLISADMLFQLKSGLGQDQKAFWGKTVFFFSWQGPFYFPMFQLPRTE